MNLTARTAILVDAAATTATAVLMLAARGVLYPYFGLASAFLLDLTAAAFIAYAAIIALVARRTTISRAAVLTIAGANIAYVVVSMALLVTFWSDLHAAARTLIFVVALAVEAFAALQFMAARRLDVAAQHA